VGRGKTNPRTHKKKNKKSENLLKIGLEYRGKAGPETAGGEGPVLRGLGVWFFFSNT